MEKEIVHKDFGDGSADLKLAGGKLILSASYSLKPIADKVIDPILEKVKSLIPGDWDSAFIDGLKKSAYEALGLEITPAPQAVEPV